MRVCVCVCVFTGVSNGLLGEWEKVQSGIHVLRQIIDEYQTPTTSNGAKNHATTAAETGGVHATTCMVHMAASMSQVTACTDHGTACM